MKKKLTLAGLALLLAAGVTPAQAGKEAAASSLRPHHYKAVAGNERVHTLYRGPVMPTKGMAAIQELKSEQTVDSLLNAFSFYTEDAQPFVYKSSINQLAMIHRGAQDRTANPGTDSDKDDLYITVSPDWGATWPARYGPLRQDATSLGARYPSMYIATAGGTTDPTYFFSAPLVTNPNAGANEWAWGSVLQGLYDAVQDIWFAAPVGPISANGGQYEWGTDCKMTSIDDMKVILVGTVTRLANPASENNAFGVRIIDLDNTNLFEDPFIPDAWRSDQFIEPANVSNPSARSSLMTGLDNDGQNIYFAASGIFKDNNSAQLFLPAISKSSDNGATWSEFDRFPESLILDYNTSFNGVVDSLSLNIPSGFVALGPDRYSLITTVSFVPANDMANRQTHIIEIYKENGSWGFRKLADHSGTIPALFADEATPNTPTGSQVGEELQLVRSVDGTKLLVKWIDFVTYTVDGTDVNSNDVFVMARDINGSWSSEPTNLTNSLMFDKITWLPNYVPNDLMDIPLLTIRSKPTPAEEADQLTANITAQRQIVGRTQYINIAKFDAAALVGVNDPVETASPLLGLASPNPASNSARIDFTLPAGGHASVDLYNAMGQKVLSLFDGQAHAGTNRVDVHTQSLPTGSYYYKLNWNGKTETRMLNVVR